MALSEEERALCDWIAEQHERMLEQTICWSSINSGTFHTAGVEEQGKALTQELLELSAKVTLHDVEPFREISASGEYRARPLGRAVVGVRHPEASRRVLLSGHLDTVFDSKHPFQSVTRLNDNQVRGPGIIDLKAGLVIMTTALRAIEQLELSDFGWTAILSPDEEIGSNSTSPLLRDHAQTAQIGLVFEPPYTDGAFVNERGSSAYYVVRAEGRSAHVGRHYSDGRSAIAAAARLVDPLEALNSPTVTVNVGSIDGGAPSNVVPALALIRINVRAKSAEDFAHADREIARIVLDADGEGDVTLSLIREVVREPKPFDAPTQGLFGFVRECCHELQIPAEWRPSGGVCDGNILAAAGLPTIDTLGALGGGIHTPDEYLEVDSLTERAQLTALLLLRFARGAFSPVSDTTQDRLL